jgi:hypothetical protein
MAFLFHELNNMFSLMNIAPCPHFAFCGVSTHAFIEMTALFRRSDAGAARKSTPLSSMTTMDGVVGESRPSLG